MSSETVDETVLRQYLLGSLAAERRLAIEQRVFSDDEVFWEHLCVAEEELIDAYVAGALDDEDKGRFERKFLCTDERRTKLEFARALAAYARERPEQKSFSQWLQGSVATPRWALAAATLMIGVLAPAAWRFAPSPPPGELSVSLASGLVRGGGELPRVRISPRTQLVRLYLDTAPGQYNTFRATLHQVDGEELWSQQQLRAETSEGRTVVSLTLPGELLLAGDYYIQLHGMSGASESTPIGRYDFRVVDR